MVISAEEVKIIDMNSEELGVSVLMLMENAGAGAARIILEDFPKATKIAIFCGVGNNGGDGFVVARHLSSAGKDVSVFLTGHESQIKSIEAKINYKILKEQNHSIPLIQIADSSEFSTLQKQLENFDLIVDALLGIGLKKNPYEPIKSAIKLINKLDKTIVSIDLPSGMFSDESKTTSLMIHADLVVTFHDTKPCLTIDELKNKTKIVGIGAPIEATTHVGKGDFIVTYPKRKSSSHKGQNGIILVIGGSSEYSGAPILASIAALRTGADLVYTCVPQIIEDVCKSITPNLIVRAFDKKHFTIKSVKPLIELSKKVDSIIIGPGIGTHVDTLDFVVEFLKNKFDSKPIIIDADAFKAIKNSINILNSNTTILTPHKGEYKLLFNEEIKENIFDIKQQLLVKSNTISSLIVLKGKDDFISDGKIVRINRTGHPGMTVGGTGDVLTGVIAALCAVNKDSFRSACAGTYLTGKAGEYAARKFGNSLLATDVIEMIPEVILDLLKLNASSL